jgi:hypothetical protein
LHLRHPKSLIVGWLNLGRRKSPLNLKKSAGFHHYFISFTVLSVFEFFYCNIRTFLKAHFLSEKNERKVDRRMTAGHGDFKNASLPR